MELVAARFQAWLQQAMPASRDGAWLGENSYGYVEISDNKIYPPYRLYEPMAANSLLAPWNKRYVTWKALISKDGASKALQGQTSWFFTSIQCLDPNDLIICRGVNAPDRREIIVEATEQAGGYSEIKVVPYSGSREVNESSAEEPSSNEILDYHILQISVQPLIGKGIASYNSQGQFLSLILEEGSNYTIFDSPYPKDSEPYYYVQLRSWSERLHGLKKPLLHKSWTAKLLRHIRKRVCQVV